MRSSRLTSRVKAQARIWSVPATYILLALALGRLVPELDARFFPGTIIFSVNTAVSLLSAIASGMLAFTGFVFSMTFLMVQFGSSAYSPRLTRYFLQDAIVRHSLGMFVGTFIYTLSALIVVDLEGSGSVSDFTVLAALGGVFGSMIFFLALIQHITALQVTFVLFMVGDRGREVIKRLYPAAVIPLRETEAGEQSSQPPSPVAVPTLSLPPVTQVVTYQGGPLAILKIDTRGLISLTKEAGAVIQLNYSIGETIPNGAALLEVHGGRGPIEERQLSRMIELGRMRTIEQDPKYAVRLIVDIAIKALSPAVNDPTTAVQALDQLDDLLRRIGNRDLDVGYAYDSDGSLRVIYPTPSWEDYLDLAFDEIRYYGASSLQVMRRLRALLQDLGEAVPAGRRALVKDHLERVNDSIDRTFPDLRDRVDARQADRQGIGVSREH